MHARHTRHAGLAGHVRHAKHVGMPGSKACKVCEACRACKIREKDTDIAQFEMEAAVVPFIPLPSEWLKGYPVELWADDSPAISRCSKSTRTYPT